MKSILLQFKFLLVEFLNVTYQLVPNPLRNYYLLLFWIQYKRKAKNSSRTDWGGVSDDCRLLLIMNNGDMAAIDEERRMAA